MSLSPIEVVRKVLGAPTDFTAVSALVAEDVRYVSLNDDNPELKRLMPWAGTGHGAEGIVRTFVDVGRYWETQAFDIEDMFGSGENVAVFRHFTYRSVVLGKLVRSPFAILAKVADGKLRFMQFMEDTFATSASFRSKGVWHFRGNPDGSEVTVGAADS